MSWLYCEPKSTTATASPRPSETDSPGALRAVVTASGMLLLFRERDPRRPAEGRDSDEAFSLSRQQEVLELAEPVVPLVECAEPPGEASLHARRSGLALLGPGRLPDNLPQRGERFCCRGGASCRGRPGRRSRRRAFVGGRP